MTVNETVYHKKFIIGFFLGLEKEIMSKEHVDEAQDYSFEKINLNFQTLALLKVWQLVS